MLIHIFEKEEPGRYVVIRNKEMATFSLDCFKEWMEIYLSKLKELKKK